MLKMVTMGGVVHCARGGSLQPQCGGRGHAWARPHLTRSLGLSAEEPVPDDRYHAIYFAMLLAGVGFLLPYNSFITDVDYLHHKYPGGPPASSCHRTLPCSRGLGLLPSRNPSGSTLL